MVPGETRQFCALLRNAVDHLWLLVDIVLDRLFNGFRNPVTNSGGGSGFPHSSLGSLVSSRSDFSCRLDHRDDQSIFRIALGHSLHRANGTEVRARIALRRHAESGSCRIEGSRGASLKLVAALAAPSAKRDVEAAVSAAEIGLFAHRRLTQARLHAG